MGIFFIDGFEDNSSKFWVVDTGSIVSSSGLEMSGNYVMNLTERMTIAMGSVVNELYIQFRYRPKDNNTARTLFAIYNGSDGGNGNCCLTKSATNYLEARRGDDGQTILQTSLVGTLQQDTTYLIKVYIKPISSGGVFQVWVDGVEHINYSGDVTSGTDGCTSFRFGKAYWNQFAAYIDDIIFSTTDITENLKVGALAITGAGATTEWDPSTGSNYQNVDEAGTPDDTNYNSTNTVNEVDTFALADNVASIGLIYAVQVSVRCKYVGTPTPKHLQTVVRTHDTNYANGTDIHPPITFNSYQQIWEVNPNTGVAWVEAELNALEIGYKAIT